MSALLLMSSPLRTCAHTTSAIRTDFDSAYSLCIFLANPHTCLISTQVKTDHTGICDQTKGGCTSGAIQSKEPLADT